MQTSFFRLRRLNDYKIRFFCQTKNLRLCSQSIHQIRPFLATSSITIRSNHDVAHGQRTTTLGLMRETYNPWERRAPLTPTHVAELLQSQKTNTTDFNNIEKILVQPSRQRIFSDQDYVAAGATLTNDFSSANVILGVKRPLVVQDLLPEKTYIFFSHTIKGQVQNMDLLRYCMDHSIQLLDYERMMQPTILDNASSLHDSSAGKSRRLVSFGRFAGLAGAIDTLGALGRRLLYTYKLSTPLLNIPPAWMHPSLEHAIESVQNIFKDMNEQSQQDKATPLVFAVTGQGGCVHSGVMEILKLLPHNQITVSELPHAMVSESITQPFVICPVSTSDVFERIDGQDFDRENYGNHPNQYRSTFAQRLAPFCHVIIHCAYWDARYPRLLTKSQLKRLFELQQYHSATNPRLLLISDLSCDVNGSMECLERTTSIERPFFEYDPVAECASASCITGNERSVTVMGVDILPAELPRESSDHFGSKVKDVVHELAQIRAQQLGNIGVDQQLLSPHLANAVITTINGALAPRYRYLKSLMDQAPNIDQNQSMKVSLEGHLFDSGLINHIFDVIEQKHGTLSVLECILPRSCGGSTTADALKSRVILYVTAPDQRTLSEIDKNMRALVAAIAKADAKMALLESTLETFSKRSNCGSEVKDLNREKNVLLLGAGRVAKSFVEYLGRTGDVRITVACDNELEARSVVSTAAKGQHVVLNVVTDRQKLSELIELSDLVVSLLPAPMHPIVAQECILQKVHLVTASYESDEMRQLHSRACDANIVILNEVGLDPGLDHMSAMKLINDIKHRSGTVTRFSSICGGLPAPEAANNPLQYKFSWSPLGFISACQNSARYRWEGSVLETPGHELLQSAVPFVEAWPELQLECLPNRDALRYETVYGIEGVKTMYRGTLRYKGFSKLMNVLQNMGMFNTTPLTRHNTWADVIDDLRRQRGGFDDVADFVQACADDNLAVAQQTIATLEWLGMMDDNLKKTDQNTVVDSFCNVLQDRLQYEPGERDMVIMRHQIDASFDDGETVERHIAELQTFGCSNGSAMAKTVGYPAAASAELILEGRLRSERGLLLPLAPVVYEPVLSKLNEVGISFNESVMVHYPLGRGERRNA